MELAFHHHNIRIINMKSAVGSKSRKSRYIGKEKFFRVVGNSFQFPHRTIAVIKGNSLALKSWKAIESSRNVYISHAFNKTPWGCFHNELKLVISKKYELQFAHL